MRKELDVNEVAGALRVALGLLARRIRQLKAEGEITLPESSALARLDRGGPATPSELARQEQISPQSIGATLAGLEARGLVGRRPDPADGRRTVISITARGQQMLGDRRNERTLRLAEALSSGFTDAEVDQLMAVVPLLERLAQSI
ncbi:MAG TPA: MarR family transcriptional regulator [Streptosporangiaceae bacterium]|nr:MarR family transcriptional regulator [Streptosporangiaceae bacterium]